MTSLKVKHGHVETVTKKGLSKIWNGAWGEVKWGLNHLFGLVERATGDSNENSLGWVRRWKPEQSERWVGGEEVKTMNIDNHFKV